MLAVDRLSATDEAFLALEEHAMPMHVGVLVVLSGAGLARPDGSVDPDAVRARVAGALEHAPRLRQRVVRVPGLGHAWIHAERFDLDAHLERVTAPRPGRHAELMDAAGRAFSPPLDRSRPLWRMTVIEGLEGGRVAIAFAAHHAMIDGVGGIGMLAAMLSDSPEPARERTATAHRSRLAIGAALAVDRAHALREAAAGLRGHEGHGVLREASTVSSGLARTLRDGLVPGARTSLAPPRVSGHRGLEGVRLDFARAQAIRGALGGTLNDVVLTTVTGAIRRTLARRGDDVDRIRRFRALVPVDLRARTGEPHATGNAVSMVLAPLPVHLADPRARHNAIRAATLRLKSRSHEIESAAWVERLGDLALPSLMATVFRVTAHLRAFQVVVTNIPGPRAPLRLGPARVDELYPLVPLFARQAVGFAILSYAGGLFVAAHVDRDAIPDAGAIAHDVERAFEELTALVRA